MYKLSFRIVFFIFYSQIAFGLGTQDLLPPDQAFRLSAEPKGKDTVLLSWDIAKGYYLYKKKFTFSSKTPAIALGEPDLPPGQIKHDEFFGEMEIYRGRIDIILPVNRLDGNNQFTLETTSQGCADLGICYPPQKQTITLNLPEQPSSDPEPISKLPNALPSLNQAFKLLGLGTPEDELLPPDQAFQFNGEIKDSNTLRVHWQIADGYYLYREKFAFTLSDDAAIQLGNYQIPHGKPKHEETFGDVEVFYHQIGFDLPLLRSNLNSVRISLTAKYQGCAERGVCYPPMEKTVFLELPVSGNQNLSTPSYPISEQSQIAQTLKNRTVWFTAVSFFGFGLLLAFTPCIFPMIPILSGIIIGQGDRITAFQGFLISLSYVVASALTFTVFGILAGLFGSNLQVIFQEPWVITTFSFVFILLALSMFGFYTLEVPAVIQSKLTLMSNNQKHGTILGAAIMGCLSTLIVGPCVAAPLAGALIYIGQTGDATLGGLALFALGMGMGAPLLLIGVSAGKLLPKVGPWMNVTKSVFGVGLLAVAIWLMERILPISVTMVLWAILLIIPAVYMGAIDVLPVNASGWRKLWKGTGLIMLTYGILMLVGVASGSKNILQPLQALANSASIPSSPELVFEPVVSISDLEKRLISAGNQGQWTMLDFYADWCVSCKEMESFTFSDPKVQALLSRVVLVQADVTKNSTQDKELLSRFDLIGPPAILFFSPNQEEQKSLRIIGYKNADDFILHLKQIGV